MAYVHAHAPAGATVGEMQAIGAAQVRGGRRRQQGSLLRRSTAADGGAGRDATLVEGKNGFTQQ